MRLGVGIFMEDTVVDLTTSLLVSSLNCLGVILLDERKGVFIVPCLRYEISDGRVVSVDVRFLIVDTFVRSPSVLDLVF